MRRLLRGVVEAALRVPVFFKIMGIAIGLTLLVTGAVSWQIYSTWNRLLLEDVDVRARLTASDLAAHTSPFLTAINPAELRHLLVDAQARTPGLAYILVLDARGALVAATLPETSAAGLLAANSAAAGQKAPHTVRLDTADGVVHDVAVPVLDGGGGVVRVGLTEEPSRHEIQALADRLIVVTLVITAVGAVAAWGLTWIITRPLHEMVQLTGAVREGRYDGRVPVWSADELGTLATAFNDMTRALGEKERMRQALLRGIIAAGEDERKRVARDLHDDTGQMLVSLIAGLGAAEAVARDDASRSRLADLRDLASRTLAGIHDLAVALRPSILDDVGLAAALRRHAAAFSKRFGVTVHCHGLDIDGAERLAPEAEVALYRIVQEALTNAVRHGHATAVELSLLRTADATVIEIADDGMGFDARRWRTEARREDQLGLHGIEERAALLGGTVHVTPGTDAGTIIRVVIPMGATA
jgi:signal transduction histidine kinase